MTSKVIWSFFSLSGNLILTVNNLARMRSLFSFRGLVINLNQRTPKVRVVLMGGCVGWWVDRWWSKGPSILLHIKYNYHQDVLISTITAGPSEATSLGCRRKMNKKIHPGSLLPMGCPNNDSNNMPVQRRKTDRRTDRQTDRQTDNRQTDRPTFFLD